MNARETLLATTAQARATTPIEEPGSRRRSVAVIGLQGDASHPETSWLPQVLGDLIGQELAASGQLFLLPGKQVADAREVLSLGEASLLKPEELQPLCARLGADLALSGACQLFDDVEGSGLKLVVYVHDAHTGALKAHVQAFGPYAPLNLVENAGTALRRQLGLRGPPVRGAARRKASGSRRRAAGTKARGSRSGPLAPRKTASP